MKVRGDNAPNNAFSVEAQPKKPGYVLVRFYAHVQPFEEMDGDLTISGYEYDEYHLELQNTGNMTGYVLEHYAELMNKAIALEADGGNLTPEEKIAVLEAENAALHGKVSTLEGQVTDAQLALCDVYELMLGGVV